MRVFFLQRLLLLFGICGISIIEAAPDKLFCFYRSEAKNRLGNGRVELKDLFPTPCTHLVYQFVTLTDTATIANSNALQTDLAQFPVLRNKSPETKLLISVGGPIFPSLTFSNLAKNNTLRPAMIASIKNIVVQNNFDGVDLSWWYPVMKGGVPEDRETYIQLLSELRAALSPLGKILTASVAPTNDYFLSSYNVREMNNYLNFVNVMAFDLYTYMNFVTGHNAPINPSPSEISSTDRQFNMNAILTGWIEAGISPQKLVLGISANGHSFKLANPDSNKPFVRTTGPGPNGPYTNERGVLSYLEVCEQLRSGGWTQVWDSVQEAHYAYNSNLWVSYENIHAVQTKVLFARTYSIAGVGLWAMEGDDIKNVCGAGASPLLSTAYAMLDILKAPPATSTTSIPTTTTTKPTTTTTTKPTTTTAKPTTTTTKPTTTTTKPPTTTTKPTTTTTKPTTTTTTVRSTTTTSTSSTRLTTTTIKVPTTSANPTHCQDNGFFRDPYDCALYYQCKNGAIVGSFRCSFGLYFDPRYNVCNWQRQVPC
ncbi:chitinase-like protein 4 isoform X1 [Uranotaenia lowii]|uniref:chitinase-like protein 4 isoform X1 n=1 Tax=Uranotaenia lowii TaxID=190385 RepID=UPI0024784C2D|nr:chitinase-like protein 4 isoform X1 [Uranotaenia lowii]